MKKVLIISYYWPPCGGIGVLRCLKMAKYLRRYGWEPIVYTAENPHYPSIDYGNEKDIPAGMTVLKGKIWEPYSIYKLLTGKDKSENVNNVFYTKSEKAGFMHNLSVWIRSNFFIPDARSNWIRPSVKFLLKYLQSNPVDAILSDGPPHSNTRIATLLKQKTGIPWLADYQDPWTQVDYYQLLNLTKSGDNKHRRFEQEAFAAADKTTIASATWKNDLESIGAKNVSVLPYGFDPDDFKHLKNNKAEKFTISHTGIVGYDRNPKTFFKVIADLIKTNGKFKQLIKISFPGQVDHSVKEIISALDLDSYVDLPGNKNRATALQMMKDSNVLLLLMNQQNNANGRVPGKLYEYLAVKRQILSLGSPEGDSAKIVQEMNAGFAFEYDEYEGIKQMIGHAFETFEKGKTIKDIESTNEPYSHLNLIKDLAGWLDEISRN